MSWSGKTKARRFAADGELAAMFRGVRKSLDNPVAQRVVRLHENAAKEFLANTPIDGDVFVWTNGHFDNDGHGHATLELEILPHERPVETIAAEELSDEPVLIPTPPLEPLTAGEAFAAGAPPEVVPE